MNFAQFCKKFKPTKTELFSEFYDLFKKEIEIKNKRIAIEKLQKIITVTFKLSSTQSFASMSLRQLADETQMSMGGLYAYIKSKQQLSLYIHQFLNHYAEKIVKQTEHTLEGLVKTHIFLSEIMRPWFFFAFMESKNLNKPMKKYAIRSELMMEQFLVDVIQKGQNNKKYNTILSAEVIAAHIKPLLHDWYLKRWKYQQRNISVDEFCYSTLIFINSGLTNSDTMSKT
jgi:AcrR family transcriptional regulator